MLRSIGAASWEREGEQVQFVSKTRPAGADKFPLTTSAAEKLERLFDENGFGKPALPEPMNWRQLVAGARLT
jgi:hypothetical protein